MTADRCVMAETAKKKAASDAKSAAVRADGKLGDRPKKARIPDAA